MELITSNLPSAKSSIQVLGQEMSLWPPIGVSLPDDDCAFQDTTAPLSLDHIPVLGVSFVGQIQGQIACSSSFTWGFFLLYYISLANVRLPDVPKCAKKTAPGLFNKACHIGAYCNLLQFLSSLQRLKCWSRTEPLLRPMIAQRAYNDEMRREKEQSLQVLYRHLARRLFCGEMPG